jgi:hypothetical protein
MTPNAQPLPQVQKPSALPIVAIVLACLGCVPLLGCTGAILGLVGIIAAVRNPAFGRLGLSIGAVGVGSMWIVVLGLIAVPNFMRFQARSKQSECKTNLKAAYTAERMWFADHDAYDTDPKRVGFNPEGGNRYLYRLGAGPNAVIAADNVRHPEVDNAALEAAVREHVPQLGVIGQCPQCEITIVCAGNIDSDGALDVWSISTAQRGNTPAGSLMNHYNDVTDEKGE